MLVLEKLFLGFNLIFVGLAILGKIIYFHDPPLFGPLAYALLFLLMMMLGMEIRLRVNRHTWLILTFALGIFLGKYWLLSLSLLIIIMLGFERFVKYKKRFLFITAISLIIVFSLIPILDGVLPIISPKERVEPIAISYVIAGYVNALAISLNPSLVLLGVGVLISGISTFRTVAMLAFLSYFYSKFPKFRREEVIVGGMGLLLAFLVRSFAEMKISGKLLGMEVLLERPAFTYSVYEHLFQISMPWGTRLILKNIVPGYEIAKIFGGTSRYTYSIFGQPVVDFGMFGILEGFLLGLAVRSVRKVKWAHVFMLTVLTICIEVGLDVPKLSAIFLLPYLSSIFLSQASKDTS
ncbi:hypothetical protein [Pyrococcus sp. ST04]|uniref:hypothetical protein n=1 Tax=Pyrococcus sp. ST04 TaxID=1183377 RepID=UPI0002605962|nr:hypothetical protein [Pyrococcus sp. ST04]AFK21779.1 hypothetical protein Py04_0174 [Pyrococcus sp. ST04]